MKFKIIFVIWILSLAGLAFGFLLYGCGIKRDTYSGTGDGGQTWDSASEEAAVTALTLDSFELFPVDLDNVVFAVNEPSKWQNLQVQLHQKQSQALAGISI